MTKRFFISAVLFLICCKTFGQHIGLSFQEAKKQGIEIDLLDSIYQSAVHINTSMAVFKTDIEQETMHKEYIKLLQAFGKFLSANNFIWKKPTKCFNRIYFNSDGSIDYFLYNFLGETEDKPDEEMQKEFQRLLNLFIKDYKFPLTAKTKFAQCSPTTYMPK